MLTVVAWLAAGSLLATWGISLAAVFCQMAHPYGKHLANAYHRKCRQRLRSQEQKRALLQPYVSWSDTVSHTAPKAT